MFGRTFLGILTVVSLLWLGYATFDHINHGKLFAPEYVFGDEDGELLIIQNPSQSDVLMAQFDVKNTDLLMIVENLDLNLVQTIYVSKLRNLLLIKTKESLKDETIRSVFLDKTPLKVQKKSLSYGKLNGHYNNNTIYLSDKNYQQNKLEWGNILYDKNADASIIKFSNTLLSVSDIYIKDNGIIEYKTQSKRALFATKVNDKAIFSSAIPELASSYEFYEADYLRFIEPEIKDSPINNWLKYGLVKITLNGQEAIITDYIEGQEPIQVLYDHFKKESKNADNDYFEGARLTKLMKNTNGFFVYQFDDYVVISGNRAICEEVVGNYKLGKTVAQNPNRTNEVYSQLPQQVNYRKVDRTTKSSISIYKNVLLTTVVRGKAESVAQNTAEKPQGSTSFVVGSLPLDVQFIDEKSFFVTTKDNKVLYFENDHKKWEQTLDGAILGDASIIDIYANQKSQLMVATGKKIYILDINGNQPGGFPINLEDQTAIQAPVFYRWKGNGNFIVALTNGKLAQYDNQGRELSIIHTKLNEIVSQPIVWVSANKPFVGMIGVNRFEMIQLENKKSYRVFDVQDATLALKLPNEVKLFGIVKSQLVAYDQKGGTSYYEKFLAAQLLPSINPDNGIIIKDGSQLKLFNSNGLQWGNIKLPFSDVSDVQIYTTAIGATFVATIDGLENKVYLWKTSGEKFTQQQFDGSKFVRYNNGYLFTVVDNLIVKYFIQ